MEVRKSKLEVPCNVCSRLWTRKFRSQSTETEFVCRVCRCADCQIVLNRECDCGEIHGIPSDEDQRVCVVCIKIRERIMSMEPELRRILTNEMDEREFNMEAERKVPFYA